MTELIELTPVTYDLQGYIGLLGNKMKYTLDIGAHRHY